MALGFDTRLVHPAGGGDYPDGATLPPVCQVNAFAARSAREHEDVFANRRPGFAYTRVGNPTVAALERAVNGIEGGAATVAYSSGMAALAACLCALCEAGDQVVAAPGLYGGTVELLQLLEGLGIEVAFASDNAPEAFGRLITDRTRALFTETIGNPRLDVADLAGLSELAHGAGVPLVVDNTVTTPRLVRPIELGADLVVNSTSKFMDGSSNSIGGTLTCSGRFSWDFGKYPGLAPFAAYRALAIVPRLRNDVSPALGGCMSPQNAFYTLLGLQTLGLRMERICANALVLARHLEERSARDGLSVRYPGLASHPQHALAAREFEGGFGGILTLRLGSRERAYRLLDSLELASIVSNIGDARTLVVHPATTIAAHLDRSQQEASGVYPDLVRVCVGIEDVEDLVADFDQALDKISEGD